ncbi:GGDEF-domain containing protein [Trinickia symbiotica]|uniref:GGDEF-domain containing protein n=2 Tax=Trinickia symbiotica TaxID=863227 RepID=A0A2N7WS23_9BURK|nr:GGDEF-domain containing protein [Trinickia symbiotica]
MAEKMETLKTARGVSKARISGLARDMARRATRHVPPRFLEAYVFFPCVTLIFLLVFWCSVAYTIRMEYETAVSAAAESSRQLADTYEAQAVRNLAEIDRTLKMVAYAYAMKGDHALEEMEDRQMLPPAIVFHVAIATSRGEVIASSRKLPEPRVGSEPFFKAMSGNGGDALFIGQVERNAGSGAPEIVFSRRLADASGRFAGIVMLTVDPSYFASAYDAAQMGRHGFLGLLGTDGIMRVERVGDDISWGAAVAVPPARGVSGKPGVMPWDAGVARFTNVRALHGFPLVAIVGLSREEALSRFRRDRQLYVLSSAAGSMLLLVLTAILSAKSWALARDRARTEERIRHMATHDALTGLPNRSLLRDRLDQELEHAQRHGYAVTVVFIDLDNFKLINDSLGHRAGDELLKAVSSRMRSCLRQADTVVRLGGDEFVLVLGNESADGPGAYLAIERVREAISEPVELVGQTYQVTCSMGMASYPIDGNDAETLLSHADAAMYRAKEVGRNNSQWYRPEMNARLRDRLRRQKQLGEALARDQFRVVYQPQVDARTRNILGVEALLRWDHPADGPISPMTFIPLAEETGLIVPIGEWVLRSACRQGVRWRRAGLPPVRISVNVSARQFLHDGWAQTVASALEDSGFDARHLELELTESLIMQDLDRCVQTMKRLQDMGVRFSIDDFGTGYSSLSALKHLPIARLKIDKSFIRELPQREDDRAIVMAVISMSRRLNLNVIAEGVETQAQVDFLCENGCDEIQGYYFSRPLTPAEIGAMLAVQPTVASAREDA